MNVDVTRIQQIVQKLPQMVAWIDETLLRHGPQRRSVASYGFERLKSFYPQPLLETTHVVEVPKVPVPPLTRMGLADFAELERINFDGITYRDTYFVRHDMARNAALHFHELVHVIQWQYLGVERFLKVYVAGFLSAGSYRDNPLEQIAYDLQARFENTAAAFEVSPVVQAHLDSLVPR